MTDGAYSRRIATLLGYSWRLPKIKTREIVSRPVPAELEVEGYFFRYEKHVVYWRRLSNDDIGIVTILHERMHQIERFQDDFGT